MADSLGEAQVAIRATMDKLNVDLSEARGRIDNAVGRIAQGAGKRLQQIGALAVGGIGMATGAVAGLGAALGKITVDAAPVQGIADAFEGMAESAGYSQDEMLDALKRGSSGMISQRDLMMSFNKAAQLVSTDFATQLPDAMQYLSKVSAATGQDIGFLMDSLVTGVGRLSPQILDNLAIQVSQAEAVERAAEMYGVQASELDKAQMQAGMMNVVLEKLAANTESMPDVTESAAAKMAQFKATMQDTKDQIGVALLPILATLLTTLGKLAESVLPPLTAFIENTLAPALQTVADVFGGFIGRLQAGYDPLTALQATFLEFLSPDLAMRLIEITSNMAAFIERAREALAPVMEWIQNNVQLSDVLMALGAAILVFLGTALAPVIGTVGAIIAVFVAVMAVVAAVRQAWESDFMGMRTALTTFWEGKVKPTFDTIRTWLENTIPAAIETVSGFWQNTLLPAIQDVWAFIQNDLVPLFEALKELLDVALALALEALAGLWENVLLPAIQAVGGWIQDNLMPIFEALAERVEGPLGDALTWLKDNVLDPVKDAFSDISGAVQDVIGWIGGLTEKLRNISLPDWLTPGSPTPFELGLRGIIDALQKLDHVGLPEFMGELQLPEPMGAMGAMERFFVARQMMPVPAEATVAGGGLTIPIYIDHVSDDIDIEVMARRIARVIQRKG